MIPPPPSSSSYPPSGKFTYDVFLSFRGTDTRTNFTDHLYTALIQKGIFTFRDDEELKSGESIGPNLLKAIEESRYVIVVFSPNYAESAWCLDEIVKVNDCRKAMGQVVLPVFYHCDPSEVRRQTGEQFGKAFEKHQERYIAEPDKVKRWKEALFEVGSLSGWYLQDGYESKVIQIIVDKIFTELNQLISISAGLVGMDSHLNGMLSCLDIGCPDVRVIGICGMGGIGKTTIAQVVFKRLRAQFDGCSFLDNVRAVKIEEQGAVLLQQQLLSDLLKGDVSVQNSDSGKDIIRHRLRSKKVLIILDDVDKEKQMEILCARYRKSFGPGSRIIITSRDEHLLREDEGDKVYKVNPLTDAEALQFFSMNAYKKDELVGDESPKQSEEFSQKKNEDYCMHHWDSCTIDLRRPFRRMDQFVDQDVSWPFRLCWYASGESGSTEASLFTFPDHLDGAPGLTSDTTNTASLSQPLIGTSHPLHTPNPNRFNSLCLRRRSTGNRHCSTFLVTTATIPSSATTTPPSASVIPNTDPFPPCAPGSASHTAVDFVPAPWGL